MEPSARERYKAFLLTPEWRALAQKVKEREDCTCEKCGTKTTYGEVHHKTYDHGWLCPPQFLEYLCSGCHRAKHPEKEQVTWQELYSMIDRLGR